MSLENLRNIELVDRHALNGTNHQPEIASICFWWLLLLFVCCCIFHLCFFSLPFWYSLPCSFSRNSLRFWAFSPSFPRILAVRQAEEILAFLVVFLVFFLQKGKEKKIRGVSGGCFFLQIFARNGRWNYRKPFLVPLSICLFISFRRIGYDTLHVSNRL